MAPTTPAWTLSAPAFTALLNRLDPNPAAAAEKYEQLRRALRKLFAWKGDLDPDAGADETLDRLARRLERGEPIADVPSFARGVARLVRLERQRQPMMVDMEATREPAAPARQDDGPWAECLEGCLDALPQDERDLILAYYVGQGASRIAARATMAQAMGLSDNALRHRAQRLRDRLRSCAEACAEARTGDAAMPTRHGSAGTVSQEQHASDVPEGAA